MIPTRDSVQAEGGQNFGDARAQLPDPTAAYVEAGGPASALTIELPRLTWEHLIVGVAFGVGVWLRFFAIDAHPLTTLEAAYAWSAWRLAEGLDPIWYGANPLFLSLQSALFWLTGGGDGWARGLSALAGMGAIALVTQWSPMLGRGGAVLLSVFVAVAPWHVAISRLGDGAAISLFLGLLAITLLSHPPTRIRLQGLGVTLGLLLASGPLAWTFVLLLAGWIAIERRRFAVYRAEWRTVALPTVVALVLGATGWLARLDGIGAISGALSVWLSQFGIQTGVGRAHGAYQVVYGGDGVWLLWRLGAEQLLLTVMGLIGLGYAWWVRRAPAIQPAVQTDTLRWLPLMTLWLAIGVLLLTAPGRGLYALTFASFPCLVGAAWLGARIVLAIPREVDWVETLTVGVTLVVLLASAWIWSTGLVASPLLDLALAQALLAISGLMLLLMILFAYWAGRDAALWLLTGMALLLACGGAVRAAWMTNVWAQSSTPAGLLYETTHGSVRQLAADLETLSAQRSGDPHKMHVRIELGWLQLVQTRQQSFEPDESRGLHNALDPVLAWYLRGFRSVTWPERTARPQPGEPAAYLIPQPLTGATSQEASALAGAVYADTYYSLRTVWQPGAADWMVDANLSSQERLQQRWRSAWRPWLRWLLYREPPTLPMYQEVQLRLLLQANP